MSDPNFPSSLKTGAYVVFSFLKQLDSDFRRNDGKEKSGDLSLDPSNLGTLDHASVMTFAQR